MSEPAGAPGPLATTGHRQSVTRADGRVIDVLQRRAHIWSCFTELLLREDSAATRRYPRPHPRKVDQPETAQLVH